MSLISVRTDVVMDVLVGSMAEEVAGRMGSSPPSVAPARAGWADATDDPAAARAASAVAQGAAADVAEAGWLARAVELERFPKAHEPIPAQLGQLVDRAAELARAEPLSRPEPDDENSVTWRIPGPGGHVRHYLALRAIADLAGAPPVAEALGLPDRSSLKRCWVFGFVLASGHLLERRIS